MQHTWKSDLRAFIAADWPYWVGGAFFAVANTLIFLLNGRPWGITSMLTLVSARVLQPLGIDPSQWSYFQSPSREESLASFGWLDGLLWLNLGIAAGALLASLLSGELRWRWPRKPRIIGLALVGGVIMGYGARLALGCNAGVLLGSIPSLSLHGWAFALFTFLGVLAGHRLFRRVL